MSVMLIVTGLMYQYKKFRLEMLIMSFLLIRITFNWFVIPSRINDHQDMIARNDAIRIGRITKNEPLYDLHHRKEGERYISHSKPVLFYLTSERQEIVNPVKEINKKGFYLVYD